MGHQKREVPHQWPLMRPRKELDRVTCLHNHSRPKGHCIPFEFRLPPNVMLEHAHLHRKSRWRFSDSPDSLEFATSNKPLRRSNSDFGIREKVTSDNQTRLHSLWSDPDVITKRLSSPRQILSYEATMCLSRGKP